MTENKRSRTSRRIGLPVALAAVAMSGALALTTGALFTDSATTGGNTFTAGTVSLDASPATAAVTASNMAPGDSSVGEITVLNDGSLAERYAVESTVAGDQIGLQLTVKTGVTTCTTAGFAATGTTVYGPATLGGATATKIVGDSATGAQAGDRVLAAGASEKLCMMVSLPLSATNTAASKISTATFTFNSEQTANN